MDKEEKKEKKSKSKPKKKIVELEFNPEPLDIEKMASDWESKYADNNSRGFNSIQFTDLGDQWSLSQQSERTMVNRECLTISHVQNNLEKLISQFSQLSFQLELSPVSEQFNDEEELTAGRMISKHFFKQQSKESTKVWEKCARFGYSFGEYAPVHEDEKTLNKVPALIFHEDPSTGFWDLNAKNFCKEDGMFCGVKTYTSYDQMVTAYPDLDANEYQFQDKNTVIRFWFRNKEKIDFVKLVGGVYKRQDLLTKDDEPDYENYNSYCVKKGFKSCIYYKVICNGKEIVQPVRWPTEDLPILYQGMMTRWSKESPNTFPYSYRFEDAQKLINFMNGQIATMAKNCSSVKVIVTPAHIETDSQRDSAENFNEIDGALEFGENRDGAQAGRDPIIVPATEIPMSLIEGARFAKQQFDELVGASLDSVTTGKMMVSGKAIENINDNLAMTTYNVFMIAGHLEFLDTVAKLNQQCLPKIITETRSIPIRQQDGTTKYIYINKQTATASIQNDIKSFANRFIYEVTVGPTGEQQKKSTLQNLIAFMSVPRTPEWEMTKDIFARNLNIDDAKEFEMRISADMNQDLIKYSNGEMSLQDYMTSQQAKMQQMQQQQMQQQIQMAKLQAQIDPEAKANQTFADAETAKTAVLGYKAETERYGKIAEAQNDLLTQSVNLTKATNEKMLAQAEHNLNASKVVMDATMQAAGDSIQNPVAAQEQRQEMSQMAQNNEPPSQPQQQNIPGQ